MSLHHYAHYPEFVDPSKRKEEYYDLIREVKEQFLQRAITLRSQLNDDRLKISFDEWNAWYSWYRRGSVSEGIMAASFLNTILMYAEELGIEQACHFESVNEGALRVLPDRTEMSPTGLAISLMQHHAGGKVCALQEDITATQKDGVITCTLINRSYDEAKSFRIMNAVNLKTAVLYSSEDVVPNTEFTASELPVVTEEGGITVVLPQHSIAQIELCL